MSYQINDTAPTVASAISTTIRENISKLLTFSWIDYTLFFSMFGISAMIGIYFGCFGSKQSSTKEYLLGGKTMGVFPIGVSLIASNISGITLLGIPSEIYMYGTQYWTCVICTIVVTTTMIYIYLPVFFKLQLNSSYEYLKMRFDSNIRNMASAIFVINTLLYVPIVIYIPALAFNQVSGINIHLITPIICVICIFYTTIGGLKAVVWTDTLQFSATLGAMIAVFYMGIVAVGGVSTIWEKAEESGRIEFFNLDPDPTVRCTFWGIAFGLSMTWLSHSGVHQASVQRFLALPSLNDAKISLLIFGAGLIITKSLSCFSGLIMYSKYYNCDPLTTGQVKRMDQLLPYYVLDVASTLPGLSGVFVSGVFSTALSTMSTSLNTLAGTIYEDFLVPAEKFKVNEDNGSRVMKILVVIIGTICVGLVFLVEHLGGVLQIAMSVHGITGGPVLGVFTLGMLFPSANSKGAFWGSIISFTIVSIMCVGQQFSNIKGRMINLRKPLSIEGCENYLNLTTIPVTTLPPDLSETQPIWLFRVSFYWYSFIGLVLVIIIGLLVSYFTKDENTPTVNKDLLSPCIYRLLPEDYSSNRKNLYSPIELKVVTNNCVTSEALLNGK